MLAKIDNLEENFLMEIGKGWEFVWKDKDALVKLPKPTFMMEHDRKQHCKKVHALNQQGLLFVSLEMETKAILGQ